MRNRSESIDQVPPRPSLTPEEQDTLLRDLDAAYVVEHSQAEHTASVAAQSRACYAYSVIKVVKRLSIRTE